MRYQAHLLIVLAIALSATSGCHDPWGQADIQGDTVDVADASDPLDTTGPAPVDGAMVDLDAVSADTALDPTTEVRVKTTEGAFVIRLDSGAAPATVANFLAYVDEGFYDGSDGLGATTFHRVISGFMVQGGGLTASGSQKQTHAPIAHESPNGRLNLRGTVAMARQPAPDTATSQFFVNHVDNGFLDYVSESEPGYVVFGEVVSGMETVDAIAAVTTGPGDVPVTTVLIESVSLVLD